MKTTARLPLALLAVTAVVLLTLTLLPATTSATKARPFAPLDLAGDLHGAPFRIRVPENWNGTLLVFAHGYRDKADHPGEVDNRNADVAPSAALEAPLLAQGYALAGTAFKDNGWDIGDSMQDTKNLAVYFRDNIAKPDHTILWAASVGTVGALKNMEQFGGIFDGSLCLCAVGQGATRVWDSGVPATSRINSKAGKFAGLPNSGASFANTSVSKSRSFLTSPTVPHEAGTPKMTS